MKSQEASSKMSAKGQILIVEDEAMLRRLYSEILSREGFEVTACSNGADALKIYEADNHAFSVVITDELMPGLSGMELCAQIRAMNASQSLLLCSGKGSMSKARRVELDVEYLAKPFRSGKLVETVTKMAEASKN